MNKRIERSQNKKRSTQYTVRSTSHDNSSVSIFILVDALGWDYIKDRPFLEDIAVTKRLVKSILGFSSGVIPSILTGKHPNEHKHWSLYFYSPETSPFKWTKCIGWIPKNILNSRIVRKIVEEISKKIMGYSGYFETYLIPVEQLHLFDICENKNIYAPKGIREGKSIFDVLSETGVDYRSFNYPLKDKKIIELAKQELSTSGSRFYFLYLSEFDAFMHEDCKDTAKVNEAIDYYEKEIRGIYETAKGKFKQVNLYVFSDHSMAAVKGWVDLPARVSRVACRVSGEYAAFYDSTMARFWFFSDEAKKVVCDYLSNLSYGEILSKDKMQRLGVDFVDNRYGEVIFLMDTGVVMNPSFMGRKAPEGMHGFGVDDGTMDAVLVSNVEVKKELRDVRDFFGVMANAAVGQSDPRSLILDPSKKIKILYFLNSLVRGGVEEHVLQLIERLDKERFEPVLVCPEALITQIKEEITQMGIRYYPVCIRRWRHIGEIRKFLNVLRKEKPDIVNSHLFNATMFAAPLAKLAKVPTVIETAHLREGWRKGLKKSYAVDRFFYRFVDKIIAVSNGVKDYVVSDKKLSPEKIEVIHNGVDLKRFSRAEGDPTFSTSEAIPRFPQNSEFKIGVIGRLEPQKGHKYFLEAIRLLDGGSNGARFFIIGDGSLKERLAVSVKRLAISNKVDFLGYRKDIEDVIAGLDLVVLPSLYEGLPLTALEAQAMSKPVVVTNVDGSPEAVINNKTGYVVASKDPLALKNAMEVIITNKDLATKMGQEGRKHIEANFDIRKQIERTEQLYKHLLNAGSFRESGVSRAPARGIGNRVSEERTTRDTRHATRENERVKTVSP